MKKEICAHIVTTAPSYSENSEGERVNAGYIIDFSGSTQIKRQHIGDEYHQYYFQLPDSYLKKAEQPESETLYPKKQKSYRDEKSYFYGRKEYIEKIRKCFEESINNNNNSPISIAGEGGIGKSALAYKAIHNCEDIFDVIIPIYFGSSTLLPSFGSLLFDMAKRLGIQIPVSEFEKKGIEEQREMVVNGLAKYKRVLVYADNYETVKDAMSDSNSSSSSRPTSSSSQTTPSTSSPSSLHHYSQQMQRKSMASWQDCQQILMYY
jgi:hypothetical protein